MQKTQGVLRNYGEKIEIEKKRGVSIMYAPHIHRSYELYFCPENITQRSIICGKEYEYTYPSAIISRPYTIHSMSCLEDCKSEFKRYVFYFNDKLIEDLGIELFPDGVTEGDMGVLFRLSDSEAEYLSSVLDSVLLAPLSERESGLIISFVLGKLYSFCKGDRIIGVGASSYYVQNILKYITEHFSEGIDTADLAYRFAVSRSKLERDFKSAIGATPKIFLESCRIGEAKNLLTTSELSIAEIAHRSGFSSVNYFYRFFKNHTGESPRKYRKIIEKTKERI